MNHPMNATLIDRRDVNEELAIVRVRPDAGQVPPFRPGQYITLGLPRGDSARTEGAQRPNPATIQTAAARETRLVRRAYSIASSAEDRDSMEFYVVLVRAGRLTPRLWTVETGGRLWMDEKARGEFTLEEVPAGRDLIMISTGTGIAPFMSMLRTYRGTGRWRRFVLIHGVRRAGDLGYHNELLAISRDDPSVVYVPLVSREPPTSGWTGLRGRVQDVLNEGAFAHCCGVRLDPSQCHVFLCGNPAMIESVRAMLGERGFRTQTRTAPGNVHFERYW